MSTAVSEINQKIALWEGPRYFPLFHVATCFVQWNVSKNNLCRFWVLVWTHLNINPLVPLHPSITERANLDPNREAMGWEKEECLLVPEHLGLCSWVALQWRIACDAEDTGEAMGSIPGLGRSPGGGPGNRLQYSCLENPMARGARWATVHRVAQSRTQLKRQHARQANVCQYVWLSVCVCGVYVCEREREIFILLKPHSFCVHLLEQPAADKSLQSCPTLWDPTD